ncbi:MAG: M20/M25/M40 family metallo-hydrolase, partial [Roseomonas sp.]|nr:M20/M25/M40 family metallo-hydrolase [Roseomonas sp.]
MTTEAQITAWLATQQEAMIAELKEMVNIDGGSYDKAGVDRTGAQVRRFLEGQGIAVEVVPRDKHGDCLRGVVPGAHEIASGNQQKNIVLMGHRDTVFPKGEPERRPFTIQGNIAYGPGVADMKAGIVMNMFVLAAFHKFGGAPGPLVG